MDPTLVPGSHLHEENPSLSSTLEPLYYSSFTTAVGGI